MMGVKRFAVLLGAGAAMVQGGYALAACGGLEGAVSLDAGALDAPDAYDAGVQDCAPPTFDAAGSSPAWARGEFHLESSAIANSINVRMGGGQFQWELGGCDLQGAGEGLEQVGLDGGITLVGIDGGPLSWPGETTIDTVQSVALQPIPDGGFVAVDNDAAAVWLEGTICGCGNTFHSCGCEDPFWFWDRDW